MQLDRFVNTVQRDLLAALPEDSAAAEHAERLAAALDSSLRLALISALAAAADELSADLAPGTVSLQLSGNEPRLVAQGLDADAPAAAPAAEPATPAWGAFPAAGPAGSAAEDGDTARFNLRVPEGLKSQAESLAAEAGQSLNSWLVKAVGFAVAAADVAATGTEDALRQAASSTRAGARQRVTGWMN
ncbi:toxin-antitoxin system HicB family antitoxin [Galactobacter valiniphilus]|uniref:Toxin-antitoxin system HicB family antitoxin n=1 Tax=Galactobacter valiniphilus TaxID=2676122 RepID=A0A399JLM4_9MICC|nr:toxin-antitoxin system HicB family antitoxin [Galactobacter valiniphilus]RII43446.1 toxin-antitoxin system HicB family antitoxin [Galactobacter valiniphilus]